MKRLGVLAALALTSSLVAIPSSDAGRYDPNDLPTIGGVAPAFGLEAFRSRGEEEAERRIVQLDDRCGLRPGETSMVLLAFVDEVYAKDDFGTFAQWMRRYGRVGLEVIAISTSADPEPVADLVAKARYPFPVLDDRYRIVAQRYGISGAPFTLLLDKECRVLGMSDKAVSVDSQRLGAAIDERAKVERAARR